ncbi:D-alanyl-D-alanine carboxypeptidase [Planotetraspora thailandica]|uniref:D-alanyl-D-alanine carboxypeptidase n=1 Tax=Planotetraspora thailandica TaxID=487172 RepID=A0A8J3UXH7_9ACTN|nr:D-alanyl-D-alanine carboxypeptidase/D-alanyl-D-alanine-endopeptidase [Planotetraspora thailandica]GII52450.1 D-alanyl-D-alanine carboxypeptidase [Planotetraspora thailandica]
MVRRERWVAVATLALLQIFVVVAGIYLITHDVLKNPISVATPKPAPTPLVTAGPVLAAAGDGALPAKGTLTNRLAVALGDPSLGNRTGGVVLDVATGATLFDGNAAKPLTPASTTKVVTATAVLGSLGPDARLATTVVKGAGKNSIILVGGGDPTLAGPLSAKDKNAYPRPASLTTLAMNTAKALKAAKITSVDLSYDASLFAGPTTAPGWKSNYVPEGSVAPVTALTMDEGRSSAGGRFSDPPRSTAEEFAARLRKYGIKVEAGLSEAKAPAGARELARVESPPVYALVEHMLTVSDNDLAEALARQVAIKEGMPHTFVGEAQAVDKVLTRLKLNQGVEVHDGSGLSTKNRITPAGLARLVAAATSPANPELHSLISGLPVAGFTGTLDERYGRRDSKAGAGLVRAKTGTLTGVNTLAGVTYTANGRLVAFAFMANGVSNPGMTVAALDEMATIVARS